jgi:hypothetical protein
MKCWILTFRVEAPSFVVSARSGGSVCFAAYSRLIDQWYLIANGSEEIMDPPEMIFVDEKYVLEHPSKIFVRPEKIKSCLGKKSEQLMLF